MNTQLMDIDISQINFNEEVSNPKRDLVRIDLNPQWDSANATVGGQYSIKVVDASAKIRMCSVAIRYLYEHQERDLVSQMIWHRVSCSENQVQQEIEGILVDRKSSPIRVEQHAALLIYVVLSVGDKFEPVFQNRPFTYGG